MKLKLIITLISITASTTFSSGKSPLPDGKITPIKLTFKNPEQVVKVPPYRQKLAQEIKQASQKPFTDNLIAAFKNLQ